ncbi:hypothetical protein [Flexistipes sp.]|uniref:hypothetical protein n=1 Tax=Flexistipes sp. TaxID=3088135 RepID=UPI002E22796D
MFFETSEEFEQELEVYIKKMQTILIKQKSFLNGIYKSLIESYEEGFEITQDEIETNFAGQYYFSEYELRMLAQEKSDLASKFINNEM